MTRTSPSPRLLPCVIAAACLGVAALAPPARAASDCKPVFDAATAVLNTPNHQYATTRRSAAQSGELDTNEMIFTGGVIYVKIRGQWQTSPMTAQQMKDLEEKAKQSSKMTCDYVRDEAIGGETAALYHTHTETERGKTDGQIWIAKNSGRPVRQELDINTSATAGTTHVAVRYDYTDVAPPAGVK